MKKGSKEYERELEASFPKVLNEADALYEGRGRLQEAYTRLSARLDSIEISYGLIGAYALIIHGVRRFTEDINVLLGPQGLPILEDSLVGKGYVKIQGSTRSIRDAETGVRIDFVIAGEFPGDGKPKPVAFPDPAEHLEPGSEIKVVDLKTLIELKLAPGMTAKGRLQDLADVERLIQEHNLTEAFAETLHPYVRAKFLELK